MKFVCDRCQTKYAIADERVRGKILKVKCKTCANVMTVREARRVSSASLPSLSALGPPLESDSERTILAPNPGLFPEPFPVAQSGPISAHGSAHGSSRGPAPAPARKTGPLAVTSPDDGVEWYIALAGERTGPFSRKALVDKVSALPRNADLHVWNEQLGAWKPPHEVPAIVADLQARRRAPPPLPPGAPRGAPPPPPLPMSPLGSHADRPARSPTGSHGPPLGAPISPGVGIKLPPPTGGGAPRPSASMSAAHAPARSSDGGIDIDPSSMLETPAPMAQHHPGHHKTNGVGSASANPSRSATRSSSDVLNLLNLPGAANASQGSHAPPTPQGVGGPRLLTSAAAVGWSPDVVASSTRARNTKLVVALLGVVGAIIAVLTVSAMRRRTLPPIPQPTVAVTDPMAKMLEKMAEPEPPPPPTIAPVPPPAPPPPVGRGKGRSHGKAGKAAVAAPAAPATTPAPVSGDAARYKDTSGTMVKVVPTAAPSRPPPGQQQIMAVINNNRGAIKTCYQRALARDNSLTRGKIAVRLNIGISGRVKQVGLDGPNQFRLLLEPCIREAASRWLFPQASEEYGTEFPLVFQGSE